MSEHVLLNRSPGVGMLLTANFSSIFAAPCPLRALRSSVLSHVLALELLTPTDAPACTMNYYDKLAHVRLFRRSTRLG
jgi:hypothetical protein